MAINILPIIAEFVAEQPAVGQFRRGYLLHWIKTSGSSTLRSATEAEQELAADCLIAAGFGRNSEQTQTVYCHCTGGNDAEG